MEKKIARTDVKAKGVSHLMLICACGVLKKFLVLGWGGRESDKRKSDG